MESGGASGPGRTLVSRLSSLQERATIHQKPVAVLDNRTEIAVNVRDMPACLGSGLPGARVGYRRRMDAHALRGPKSGFRDREMKLLELEALAKNICDLKTQGKVIVHCHGCFDLMHPGHVKYFQAAKKMGDILVVTVTPDRYVDKGTGRPVFCETLRAECIAALECVDYVAINQWPTAVKTLKKNGTW